MPFIVYITDDCLKEAKEHGFEKKLEKLQKEMEKTQNIPNRNRFGSSKYLKQGLSNHRLIMYEYDKPYPNPNAGEDYKVIIFLTVFPRGDNDYDRDSKKYLELHGDKLLRKINKKDLDDYVEKTISIVPLPSKPLTDDERSYLYNSSVPGYDLDNEETVYESKAWVKAVNQEKFSSILPRIYDTVNEIVGKKPDNTNEISVSKRSEKIIFEFDKSEKRLSLLDLVTEENCKADYIRDTVNCWKQKLEENASIVKRAYPQYILALKEEEWMEIEKDPQSNFNLSKEEKDILNDCSKNSAFPLFINGRAGSGKSTILQYLYADYFSRYISYKDTQENPPVYFSYNSELLQRAKKFVKSLIKCNSVFVGARDKLSQDLSAKLEGSFKELRDYLISIVPPEERAKSFDRPNYVSFTRFRKEWGKKFKTDKNMLKKYSPDISWHVIRTYIQGRDTYSLLEPTDYDNIEEKQKTVSKQDFKTIYDKVWTWYQEIKKKDHLWDDQDLARHILDSELAKPSFPGIFCDEAQDFTRVEMELLLRLSSYSYPDRDIPPQDSSRIPFAFAGDEFQTLNPTGFRWEALKAGFTEKLILPLCMSGGHKPIDLNYRVLENNYRSLPEIVRFCNTFQLFRAIRFGISKLRPQKYWESQSAIFPVASFYSDDAEFWEKIQKLTDTVFIIPCDEGQEVEWIREDKELKQYIKIENDAPLNMRVLSANLAKGLEFDHVVVYGFGSDCPPEMIEGKDDENSFITLQYYINKTYVAISRAKKRLFIVDTQEGMDKLWNVTINKKRVESYIEKINERNPEKWSLDKDISFLISGFPSLMEDLETNTEEVASQLWHSGRSERKSFVVQQAAYSYRDLGKDYYRDADKCEATAYLFDEKYIQAGTKYADSGFRNEAIKAFWLANSDEGYKKIVQNAEQYPDYKVMYSIALAMIKNDKKSLADAIKVVSETSKETLYIILKSDEIFMDYELNAILQDAVNKIVQMIIKHIDPSRDNNILYQIIDILKLEIKITPADIADIAYTLKEYKKAVEYWGDKPDIKDNEKYTTAKAFSTKFPENLPLFKSVNCYDEIINQYNLNKEEKLSEDHLCIIAEALLIQKKTEKALQICERLASPGSFDQLAKCYTGSNKAIQNIFYILAKISEIRKEDWTVIWDILDILINKTEIKNKTNTPIVLYFAAAIARFDSFLTEKEISKFLREEIIEKSLVIPDELVIDVGTAVEKAGHRLDALNYYEHAESAVKTDELKRKCAERWIKAKERQAKNTPENDIATRDKRNDEAVTKRKQYDIPEKSELPEYEKLREWTDLYQFVIKNESKPNESKLKIVAVERHPVKNNASESPHPQLNIKEFERNGYKFTYYDRQKRLNVTDLDGKVISITQNNHSSSDYTVEEVSLPDGKYKYIKDTPILFQNTDKILVKFSDTGFKHDF